MADDDPDFMPMWGWSRRRATRSRPEDDDVIKPKPKRRKKDKLNPFMNPEDALEELRTLKLALKPYEGIARPPLKIAAFNIQTFGKSKMKKKDATGVLVKILQRYDLILVIEIRDRSHTALDKLVELVSSVDPGDPFTTIVSERLGRTKSKEQYAFMYRYNKIQVQDIYQYDDGEDNGSDVFQREPFAVRFKSPGTAIQDFAIIAIHTDPHDAVRELAGLAKVYEVTKKHWGLEDIIIAGDFNADEGYVNRDDWSKIALRNDRRFKWMIDDETDTTVGNTDRAYDRFVVAGKKLIKGIVKGSSGTFKFDEAFGLSNEEAEDVSDHYPIEMELSGKPNLKIQDSVQTNMSFTIRQKQPIDHERSVRRIYRTDAGTEESAFFTHLVNYDDSRMQEVVARREGVDDVMAALKSFQEAFPDVIFDDTLVMVKAFMDSPIMSHRDEVYGLIGRGLEDRTDFDIVVTVSLVDPLQCQVSVIKKMS